MITLLAFCRHNTSCGEVSDVGEEGENDISVEITAGIGVPLSTGGSASGCGSGLLWNVVPDEERKRPPFQGRDTTRFTVRAAISSTVCYSCD